MSKKFRKTSTCANVPFFAIASAMFTDQEKCWVCLKQAETRSITITQRPFLHEKQKIEKILWVNKMSHNSVNI